MTIADLKSKIAPHQTDSVLKTELVWRDRVGLA